MYSSFRGQDHKEKGDSKWNSRYGYGFKLGSKGNYLTGDKFWQPKKPATKEETVSLYKLHGSLHFNIGPISKKHYIKLKQRPYTKQNGNAQFTIIPPEWNKKYDMGVFANIWQATADKLHKETKLIIAGYSMPPTDLHAMTLFTTSLRKHKLKSLVLINPDKEARYRIRSALQRAISPKTKILSFDYLPEFLKCHRSTWD